MALVNTDDVQAWFTDNRLSLEVTDELPEEGNVSLKVLAKVSTRYDVSTWLDRATTPGLIKSIISAQVAAIRYRKHYADQDDELAYAGWLDEWAMTTLEGICNGTIPLLDVTDSELLTAQTASSAVFYPTDAQIDDDAAKFTMDMTF